MRLAVALSFLGFVALADAAPKDASSPKDEAEQILNALLPAAQQLLEKHAEFYPIAGAMLADKEIALVAMQDVGEHPSTQSVLDGLLRTLRAGAKQGKYRATGLAIDVRVAPPGATEKTDCVEVRLDHVSGYSVQVVFPYKLTDHRVVFSTPFAARGSGDMFPTK